MYKGSHDSWERLVEVVLQREQLREIALDQSWSPSTSSSVSTSRYSSSDVDNKVKMVEDMRRNGVHHRPYTEPKMKGETSKIRQQIIQATTYFKNLKLQKKEKYVEKVVSETENTFDKIVFFKGCNFAFDLQDLLSASSEILGKETFGFTHSVQLKNGQRIVVKRLKEVKVSMLEFEEQMKLLGSIKHENVVIPRGYHFSRDYKFVLYDHHEQGSVSAMLHGMLNTTSITFSKTEDRYSLDWKTRLRIAIGTARGISHIHIICGGNLIHGNIKASNVFLNSHRYGCISDLGFANFISPAAPPFMWIGGYAAPEVMDTGIVSQASDVYSFGVLLLELLTGKSPINYRGDDEAEDFVKWVHSIVREEWNVKFDVNNFLCTNIGVLVEILKIGMSCIARVPEHRPKMSDVLKMMENVGKLYEDLDYSPLPDSETLSTDLRILSYKS